jgi:hypothetical protein
MSTRKLIILENASLPSIFCSVQGLCSDGNASKELMIMTDNPAVLGMGSDMEEFVESSLIFLPQGTARGRLWALDYRY